MLGVLAFIAVAVVLTVVGLRFAGEDKPAPPSVDAAWRRFAEHFGLTLTGEMPSVSVTGALSNGVQVAVVHSLERRHDHQTHYRKATHSNVTHGVSYDMPTLRVAVTIPTTRGFDVSTQRMFDVDSKPRTTGDPELDAAFCIARGSERDVMLLREPAVRAALLAGRAAVPFEIEDTQLAAYPGSPDAAFVDTKLASMIGELVLVAQAIAAAKEARAIADEAERPSAASS